MKLIHHKLGESIQFAASDTLEYLAIFHDTKLAVYKASEGYAHENAHTFNFPLRSVQFATGGSLIYLFDKQGIKVLDP